MNEKCIFCDIVNSKIKSYKIDETKNFIAILDLFPIEYGHTLVISKKHYQNFLEVSKDDLNEGIQFVAKISKEIQKKIHCDGFNITTNINKCANQIIFHFHWHIIPRYNKNPYKQENKRTKMDKNDFLKLQEKLKCF
ncbi:HIT domain-containing protein [symbiont of Argiope bruennichi]|uniref:HIT family protein n=1 Tax=symbiont of Argiope bruennichi TaxID=2810479 RepID=UPI003DA5083E